MSICLSNLTADRVLRTLRRRQIQLDAASSSVVAGFEPDSWGVAEAVADLGIAADEQVEVLVPSQSDRRSTGRLVTHLCTRTPPENSFYVLDEGLYLPTPCFCLLQQARELHLINLCQMLGYYLGTEQIQETHEGETSTVTLGPLVTEEELWLYLKEAKGMKGVVALRQALRYTCANAASPQETNLQLLLTLPAAYYGYGLRRPIMNYEVPLSPDAQLLCGKKTCRIDLYWPEADRGLEYQGEEHGQQLGKDYARHLALSMEKKHVTYLAKEQLSDVNQMNYIAHLIGMATGASCDGPWWPDACHTQRLIDILVGGKIPRKDERRRLRTRS